MVDFAQKSKELKAWKELPEKDRFIKVFLDFQEELINSGVIINKNNKDKVKAVIKHIVLNHSNWKSIPSAGFMGNFIQFAFGKYKGYNYIKILQIDKDYYKWYIENITYRKDCLIDMVKEIWEIYYE